MANSNRGKKLKYLAELEPHFKLAIDRLSEGFVIASPIRDNSNLITDFLYLYVNDALAKMAKLNKEDLIGKNISDIIPGFLETELFKFCKEASESGEPRFMPGQYFKERINGKEVEGYFDISITGSSEEITITLHDVTEVTLREAEFKKTAEELDRSQEDFRLLFENSFDALFLTQPDGTINRCNASAERLFGYTEEELLRLGRDAITDYSDPNLKIALSERERTGKFAGVLSYKRKDGTTFPGEISTMIFKTKDGTLRTSTVVRDITERINAEKKIHQVNRQLQEIIDGAPNIIFAKDLEGRFILINKMLEELLGIKNEKLKGKTDFDIFPMEWAEYYQENDRKIAESGKPMQIEEEADLADGIHHYFMANKFPLLDDNGKPYAICSISTDITELKKMENELRQSEEKFRLLAEGLPLFIWSADTNGKVDFVTGQWEEHSKYLFETEDGWNWQNAIHPDDRQMAAEAWIHSVETGEEYQQVQRLRKNTGEYVWKLTRANPMKDNSGKIIKWYGTTVDINEQKRLEASLRESEERFRIVQEVSPDGFTILSPCLDQAGNVNDFIFVYENPAVARMNGTIPEEVIGHRLLELFPGHMDTKFFQTYKEVYETGKTIEFEDYYQGESITDEKWFRIVTVKIKDGIAILAQDITYRKHAEEALKESEARLIEAQKLAHIGSFENDLKSNRFTWTEELYNIYGIDPKKKNLTQEDVIKFVHPDDKEYILSNYGKAVESKDIWELEYRIITDEGKIKYLHYLGRTAFDPNGEPVKRYGTIMDITERKLQQIKLEEVLLNLERSNTELEQFAYIASHDLQEPLRMVSSYMGMLQRKYKGQLDDKAQQYIHYAVDGSKRMTDLIHDLLSYSRLTTKSEPFRIADFNTILADVRRDLQVAIMETRTDLEIDTMPQLKADATQIKQLFQNLIQNALKFRNKENPYVKVTAENKGKEWIFGVKDNGIGISPEHHERIFMLFQRLHERDKYPGTGLGLAICKKIVEHHGGRIWIESEEGKGTTFFFTLPQTPVK